MCADVYSDELDREWSHVSHIEESLGRTPNAIAKKLPSMEVRRDPERRDEIPRAAWLAMSSAGVDAATRVAAVLAPGHHEESLMKEIGQRMTGRVGAWEGDIVIDNLIRLLRALPRNSVEMRVVRAVLVASLGRARMREKLKSKYPYRLMLPSEAEIRGEISRLYSLQKAGKPLDAVAGRGGRGRPAMDAKYADVIDRIVAADGNIKPAALWTAFKAEFGEEDVQIEGFPTEAQVKSKLRTTKKAAAAAAAAASWAVPQAGAAAVVEAAPSL